MKTKTSKQPKPSKPTVRLKDMKPKKNPKGGLHEPGKIEYPN
jgi:hypothetical protein